MTFQSTHPMRDATPTLEATFYSEEISIHASHAGCDPDGFVILDDLKSISIHASHAGCDSDI